MKLDHVWAKKHRISATIILLLLIPIQCVWITAWKICNWFDLNVLINAICDLWDSKKGQND